MFAEVPVERPGGETNSQATQKIYQTPSASSVSNEAIFQLRDRIEALQTEIQLLRGEQETQSFKIQGIEQRLRDLYLDLDRRMQQIESDVTQLKAGAVTSDTTESQPEPVENTDATQQSSVNNAGQDPQSAYRYAFNHLKSGRYQASITAFESFLKDNPGSTYAPNAQYWLGEAHYALRQFNEALSEFESVVEKYPDSAKVPDALLKKGYILYEFKSWDAAEEIFMQIQQKHPGSSAARLATSRLEQLQRDRL